MVGYAQCGKANRETTLTNFSALSQRFQNQVHFVVQGIFDNFYNILTETLMGQHIKGKKIAPEIRALIATMVTEAKT